MRDARILQDHAGELPRAPAAEHPLVERCAAASMVLIGGATHGTHEFHDLRAQVTRRLVEDHGFRAVAVEGLTQLPPWVWRHRAVQSFMDWLHERRVSVASGVPATAFVGLDRYDLADEPVREALSDARLERAIGVAYHPENERARHYFGASLAHQFDIVCHIDRTSALEPDDKTPPQDGEERHGTDRHGPLRGPKAPRLAT